MDGPNRCNKMKNISTINEAINQVTQQLAVISDTPRLDAELLLALILQKPRPWLFMHLEHALTSEQQQQIHHLTQRRANAEPMAYILGHKEFWGLKFKITADVLVPRPETEHIVEWVLANFPEQSSLQIADLGTGSGAIALSLAVERPVWRIDATDQSLAVLAIAKQNAAHHQLENVNFFIGDWCKALPQKNYAVLISNPPYIAENDPHLKQLTHEPTIALCAGEDGLTAIREIIAQAPEYLAKPGYLILEHGYDQAPAVIKLLKQQGFTDVQSHYDLAHHPRFVTARYQ